ncbi:MAG TPA: PQQ-binding-like beta-propeller repeat protein [Myxococcota bacterium]|nr:PQQ-binding-like beta-propeller repeat protein [Myxococcota bacterium]
MLGLLVLLGPQLPAAGEAPITKALDGRDVLWARPIVDKRSCSFQASEILPPFIAGGVVYFIADPDHLVAVELVSGSVRWRVSMADSHWGCNPRSVDPYRYRQGMLGDEGDLILSCGIGRVVRLRGRDGKVLWTHELGDQLPRLPILAGEALLLVGEHGRIDSIDRRTGVQNWSVKVGETCYASGRHTDCPFPAMANEHLVVGTFSQDGMSAVSGHGLVCIDLQDGRAETLLYEGGRRALDLWALGDDDFLAVVVETQKVDGSIYSHQHGSSRDLRQARRVTLPSELDPHHILASNPSGLVVLLGGRFLRVEVPSGRVQPLGDFPRLGYRALRNTNALVMTKPHGIPVVASVDNEMGEIRALLDLGNVLGGMRWYMEGRGGDPMRLSWLAFTFKEGVLLVVVQVRLHGFPWRWAEPARSSSWLLAFRVPE